ncbi:hypothetical protein S7711_04713 [Stachybotrys chartarum IBT 7711]|uniref:FAD-binding domain-containing protein n=1 Tax=Stachybotrys chartarum (strain CBS 109288 / IBT 7711) TaxID=1280523 RepID=A0A084AP02_STACB|nr:hypothetical protein S7711_04713 [Stachybotrys chartarum IBT 7711]
MATTAFKVIIVGGGPVGLTAAHALSRAGIDFTLLERRDSVVIDAGSNIVLSPQGLRALAQLNVSAELNKYSEELDLINRIDHNGRNLGEMHWFSILRDLFGKLPQVISRHDLTSVLYGGLSSEAKAKLLTNKKLTNVKSTPISVTVSCEDGTSYSGHLLIGADGAHSSVRQFMRNLALEAGSDQVNAEKPFLTTYRCLWIRFPADASPELRPGFTSETHGPGAATQLFLGDRTGVTGMYERLDEPTTERMRYTQKDQEECIRKWGFLPLAKGGSFRLREAYEKSLATGMVSLEEGVVDHWSWGGRIVLVGDAAHKFTPSTGAGCNHGIGDVAVLANVLNKTLTLTNGSPSEDQMAKALREYRDLRYRATRGACAGASRATGSATWATGVHRFIDTWVLWFEFVQRRILGPKGKGSKAVADSPIFNYIPADEPFTGKREWTYPMPRKTVKA